VLHFYGAIDMQRFILAIITMASLFIVSGCGQSGPLYLPGNPSRIEKLPPLPTGSEQEQGEEKEKSDTSPN
jgi:predicted small lipoprotein YifL